MAKNLAEEQFINECVKAISNKNLDHCLLLSGKDNGQKRFQIDAYELNLEHDEHIILLFTSDGISRFMEKAGFSYLSNEEATSNFKRIIKELIEVHDAQQKFQKILCTIAMESI
jgi:16S rRNA G1207 methylase RsmC